MSLTRADILDVRDRVIGSSGHRKKTTQHLDAVYSIYENAL